mgnify:CR=1 FL=1
MAYKYKDITLKVGNSWTDDNGFLRSGYFCRKDLIKVNQVLKEIKYRKI